MNTRPYFHRRKQKAGLAMLFLACLAFAGWGRSQNVQDTLSIPTGSRAAEFFLSTNRMLAWQSCRDLPGDHTTVPLKWTSLPRSRARFGAFDHPDLKWHWRWGGCGIGTLQSERTNGGRYTLLFFSYWYVIVPLTLAASWLLWPIRQPDETPSSAAVTH